MYPSLCRSLPLAVEWSPHPPWEEILVGFHDGAVRQHNPPRHPSTPPSQTHLALLFSGCQVAIWRLSLDRGGECSATRVLCVLSTSAAPIRALAWAPPGM